MSVISLSPDCLNRVGDLPRLCNGRPVCRDRTPPDHHLRQFGVLVHRGLPENSVERRAVRAERECPTSACFSSRTLSLSELRSI
jgi:hypothetical protein